MTKKEYTDRSWNTGHRNVAPYTSQSISSPTPHVAGSHFASLTVALMWVNLNSELLLLIQNFSIIFLIHRYDKKKNTIAKNTKYRKVSKQTWHANVSLKKSYSVINYILSSTFNVSNKNRKCYNGRSNMRSGFGSPRVPVLGMPVQQSSHGSIAAIACAGIAAFCITFYIHYMPLFFILHLFQWEYNTWKKQLFINVFHIVCSSLSSIFKISYIVQQKPLWILIFNKNFG